MAGPLIQLKRRSVLDTRANELILFPCSGSNNTNNQLINSISLSDKPETQQSSIGHVFCGFNCFEETPLQNSAQKTLNSMNKMPLDSHFNNSKIIPENNQDNDESSNNYPSRLINPSCARLIPYKPLNLPITNTIQGGMSSCGNKLSFSTSGLTVTSQDSTVQTAISNIGLHSGEHIWQFICPISCEGVEFGVISIETGQEMFLSFNTTTPRQLTFKVNFDSLRFLVFLNGNLHEKKSTNLPVISKKESSFWYPAVRLKETGMTVIFNPFAMDPSSVSSTNIADFISGSTYKNDQVNVNTFEIESKRQNAIQRIEEAADSIEIAGHKEEEDKEQSKLSHASNLNAGDRYNSIINSFEAIINKDNLILLSRRDGKLKLIRRTSSGRFELDSCAVFENKPRTASDTVCLILSRNEWKELFSSIDWSKLAAKYEGMVQQTEKQGEAIQNDQTKNNTSIFALFMNSFNNSSYFLGDYIHMYVSYDVGSAVTQILSTSLKQMYLSSQNYSTTTNSSISTPQCDIVLLPSSSQAYPLEQLLQLMTISLALVEQLFGMTLHSSAQSSLIHSIQPQLSRSYSSYSRLSSLVSCCKSDSYSQIELAESGVFNASDMIQSLHHFESPHIPLQLQVPQGNCSSKPSLTKDLAMQLPNNRMVRGQLYFNVPLHVTINSIPYSQHSTPAAAKYSNPTSINKQTADDYWLISSQSNENNNHNYICSACSDGSVSVWNTEIQLFSVLTSDFTAAFVPPKQLKGLWSTNDLKANLKNVELGLFYQTGRNDDLLKEAAPAASILTQSIAKAENSSESKTSQTSWTCKHCTFLNTDTQHRQLVCAMCLQHRDDTNQSSSINEGNTTDSTAEAQKNNNASENYNIQAQQNPVYDDDLRKNQVSLKNERSNNEYTVQRESGIMAVSKLSKLCPLIVGLCLIKQNQEQTPAKGEQGEGSHDSNEQKKQNSKNKKTISLLRIRRFGFSPESLTNYYKLMQTIPGGASVSIQQSSIIKLNLDQSQQYPAPFNDIPQLQSPTASSIISQRGLVSQLTGELLSESTMGCIEDSLFRTENSRISVESLEPVFLSNIRFSSDSRPHAEQLYNENASKQQKSLVNQSWIATCERDIVLPEGVRIRHSLLELNNGSCSSSSNSSQLNRQETYSLFILTNEYQILVYQIILDNVNPYNPDSLQVSSLSSSVSLKSMVFKEVAADCCDYANSEENMNDQSALLLFEQKSQELLIILDGESIVNLQLNKEQVASQQSQSHTQAKIIHEFTQPIVSYCKTAQQAITFLVGASSQQQQSTQISQCAQSLEIITIPAIEQQQSLKVSQQSQVTEVEEEEECKGEQEENSQAIDKSNKLEDQLISLDGTLMRQLKSSLEYSPLGSRVISNKIHNQATCCPELSSHRLLDSATQLYSKHAFNKTITLSFDKASTNSSNKNAQSFHHFILHLAYSSQNQQSNSTSSSGVVSSKQQLIDTPADLISLPAVEYISAECSRLQDRQDCLELLSNPTQKPVHIPLTLVASKGAQLSFQQQESSMLSPNQESFITNYSKASFTFANLHQSSMRITAVVVHSVTQSQLGAFPIGSGLIFISDNISFFEMTEQFQGMNLAAYRAWQQNRILASAALKPWEPVGCFEFQDGKEATRAEMDVIRAGKYVHLLPTGFRTQPVDYSAHFNSGILDIQYFGVEGAIEKEGQYNQKEEYAITEDHKQISSLNSTCSAEQLQEEILDSIAISVRLLDGRRIKVKSSDIRIKSRVFERTDEIDDGKKQKQTTNAFGRIVELHIRSKVFVQNIITELTVTETFTQKQTAKKFHCGQSVLGIEIECKGTAASSRNIVEHVLKNQSYENLCLQILKSRDQHWSEDRVNVLLGLIQEEDSLDEKVKRQIDWQQLISQFVFGMKQNHYHQDQEKGSRNSWQKEEEEGVQTINNNQSILKVQENQIEQSERLAAGNEGNNKPILKLIHASNHQNSTSIKAIFTHLLAQLIQPINNNTGSDNYINKPLQSFDYSSFHRLFILLKYTRNIMDVHLFQHCLQILNSSLIAYQTAWNRHYSFLRCDHFITSFPFEKYLFLPITQAKATTNNDILNPLNSSSSVALDSSNKGSNSSAVLMNASIESIPCRILSEGEGMINRTYIIDLMKIVDVQHVELQFEKASKQCAARMKIQIYNAIPDSSCENGYSKHLVFAQDYTTATVYQLSVLAHQRDALSRYFRSEIQGLDKLGINLASFRTRYLFIQCTFSLLPYIATSTDIQQATRIHVLPNIKGYKGQNTNRHCQAAAAAGGDVNDGQNCKVDRNSSSSSIPHFEELFDLKLKDEMKTAKNQQNCCSFGYVKYHLQNNGSYILDSSGYYAQKVLVKGGESNKDSKTSSRKAENMFSNTNITSIQIVDKSKDFSEKANNLDFEGQLQFVSNNFLGIINSGSNSTQQQTKNKEKRKPKNKVIQPSLSRRAPQQQQQYQTPKDIIISGEAPNQQKISLFKDQLVNVHPLVKSSPSMLQPMEDEGQEEDEQTLQSPLPNKQPSIQGAAGSILLSSNNPKMSLVSSSQSSIMHPVEAEDEEDLEYFGGQAPHEIGNDPTISEKELELNQDQLLQEQQQQNNSMEDAQEEEGYELEEDNDDDNMVSEFAGEQFIFDCQDEDYQEIGKWQELEHAQEQLKIFLEEYHLLRQQQLGYQQSKQFNVTEYYSCSFDISAQMDQLKRSIKDQCDMIYKLQVEITNEEQINNPNNNFSPPKQYTNNLSYLSSVISSLCGFLRIDGALSVQSNQSSSIIPSIDQPQQPQEKQNQLLSELILGLFETFVLNEVADLAIQVRQLLQDVLIPAALAAGIPTHSLADQILRRHMLDQHLSQRCSPARVLSQINYLNLLSIDQAFQLLRSIVSPLIAQENQNKLAEKEELNNWTLAVSLCVLIKNEYIKLSAKNHLKALLLPDTNNIDNSESLRVVSLIFFHILSSKTITVRVFETSSVMQPLLELLIEVLPRVSMLELLEFESKLFSQETQQNLLYLLSICVCLSDDCALSCNNKNNSNSSNNKQPMACNIWQSLNQFLDLVLLPMQFEGLKQPSNINSRSSSNAYLLMEQDINLQYKNQLAFMYLLQLQTVHVIHYYSQLSSSNRQKHSSNQTDLKEGKQNNDSNNQRLNIGNPYSQVQRNYIKNKKNGRPDDDDEEDELRECQQVSLGHLDLLIALLAFASKTITSYCQRHMQASPSKKLLELQIRRRKSSESSRKGSWASRKGSEDMLSALCRKKSNTLQEGSLQFKTDYSLLLSLADYVESAQYEGSPLIMIQFVIDIVEQLLLNEGGKDSKTSGNYYPAEENAENNDEEDEEHKDFVNEQQQSYNQKKLQSENQRFQYFDYIQEKSNSPLENNDNFVQLEQRWILAMAAIGLLPGKAIQESNIFMRLAIYYLESPMDIQERQLCALISLTKNILHTCLKLKEFCEELLSLVFKVINNEEFSWEGHQLRLVVSWLEMLLSKQFPPEDAFYFPKEPNKSDSFTLFTQLFSQKTSNQQQQQQQQLATQCMCQLSVQGASMLLRQTSSFLLTHVNIGGVQGSEMGDEHLQNKLIVSDLLLRLIMSAESSHHRLAFVQAIHSQNSQHLIQALTESLSELINFSILNCGHSQVEEDKNLLRNYSGVSPCSSLSKSVEEAVMSILRLSVESSPLIIGQLVSVLLRFSDDLHKELQGAIIGDNHLSQNPSKKGRKLAMSVAISLAERESRVFTKLLECWMQDDSLTQVLFSHDLFTQLLSIARILQNPLNDAVKNSSRDKRNNPSDNKSQAETSPLQALTWILQGQQQHQGSCSSSELPWNSLQYIQSPDCIAKTTSMSSNGSRIAHLTGISCDLKQDQLNHPSLPPSLKDNNIVHGSSSNSDSLKKSMLPPLPSQQLFSQLSWNKNPSQLMMAEQGIFGNSEISENPKSSFLKYQITHPSYLNSNNNNNAPPPPIQNNSVFGLLSSYHANLSSQLSNHHNQPQQQQQQQTQLPSLSPMQQVAQVLAPLVAQGSLAKMDILSDLVSKYTNQQGSLLSIPVQQQQPDSQQSPYPYAPFPGTSAAPLGIVENTSLGMSKIPFKATQDPLIYGPVDQTIPQPNSNSNYNPATISLKPLQEVECANQVALVPLPGMPMINQQPQDWSFNKKGGKSKLLQYFMTGAYHQELPLLFKLNKTVELKKIRIGFNTISIDTSESILGVPSGVLVEGGTTKNNLLPLGMLIPLNDEKYSQFGVRVFSKNFWRISSPNGSIKDSIQSLCYPRVSLIQLRIFRPCVSVMEDISTLSSKSLSKIGISVNFLSILGFTAIPQVVEVNNKVNSIVSQTAQSPYEQQQEINTKQILFKIRQQGVLKVLGRLCNGHFPKTIKQLSQSERIVESLKAGFNSISEELLTSEESFSELLLKLSDENSAFGDWLFEQVLVNSSQNSRRIEKNTRPLAFGYNNNASYANSSSKLLLKIMKNQASLSSNVADSQQLKTTKLLTFIESQIAIVAKSRQDSQSSSSSSSSWFSKISCIFPVIEALLIGMQILPNASSTSTTPLTYYLPMSSSFINNLIKILNQSSTLLISTASTPSWFKLLTRLLSNLLYCPSQFRQTDKTLRCFTLNKIWNHIKQSPASHQLAKVLAVFCKGSKDARQFFCQRIPELAEILVSDLRALGNAKPNYVILQKTKQAQEDQTDKQSTNKDVSDNLLRAREITRILAALGKDLASLSRTIQSQPLPLALFSLLKRSKTDLESTTVLRHFVDRELLSAFSELFIESFYNSKSGAASLSEVIVADTKRLGEKRDRLFVEELLRPLLSAQKTTPICIHVFEESTQKEILNPLEVLQSRRFNGRHSTNTSDSQQTDWSDQFTTQIFSKSQKNSFTRILKQFSTETGLFKKLKDYSWTKQAVQTHDGEDSLTATLQKSVLNNPPYIVLMEGKNNGIKCVCGVFCTQPLATGAQEFGYSTYKIATSEDCFMFYYSEDYQLHFRIEGNELGSLEVAENHSFLSFKYREMDRITISLSATSTSFVDINLFDMKPLESGSNIPHDIPNEFTFGRAEYWVLKPLGISNQEASKTSYVIDSKAQNIPYQYYDSIFEVSSRSTNLLFPQSYYSSESAFNFYRVPPVFHFPSGMTLKEVILEINVNGMHISRNVLEKMNVQINSKEGGNLLIGLEDKTLQQIEQAGGIHANGIIDMSVSIDEFFKHSEKDDGSNEISFKEQQTGNSHQNNYLKDNLRSQSDSTTPKAERPLTMNNKYSSTNQILKCFIAQKGVEAILQSITDSLASQEDSNQSKRWSPFIKETRLYGGLPGFFTEMMRNEVLQQTLFLLLAQDNSNSSRIYSGSELRKKEQFTPTSQEEEKEEEQQRKAFKEIYGIVARVLRQDSPDNIIKQTAVKLNILQQLFERVSQISKEQPREYIEDVNAQIKKESDGSSNKPSKTNKSKGEIQTQMEITGVTSTAESSLPKKKKGIGYGTDQTGWNSKWNTNEYIDSKRNRNELLLSVIQAVCSFLEGNWKVPRQLQRSVCSSGLIALLENAFRSGSLLDMSNQKELILEYLNCVELLARQDSLLVALLPLGAHYRPKQISSVHELLQNLSKTADIFVHCLHSEQQQDESSEEGQGDTSTQKQQAGKIADRILIVMECLERSIIEKDQKHKKSGETQLHSEKEYQQYPSKPSSSSQSSQSLEIAKVLSLPLSQKYKILLSNLRFGYVSMQDPISSEYIHHYRNAIHQSPSASHNKIVRLAQEVADMSNALPVEDTNSVFARCDTKRVDVMKCLIMGSAGTPYAHGAFLYDVFFEDNYPNSSPKVNLSTTGPGQVRFNPNLYQCGKGKKGIIIIGNS